MCLWPQDIVLYWNYHRYKMKHAQTIVNQSQSARDNHWAYDMVVIIPPDPEATGESKDK